MSKTSIISCGPTTCNIASKESDGINFCGLSTCEPNSDKKHLQSCQPDNCTNFWDHICPEDNDNLKENNLKNKIFDFPHCYVPECPKQKDSNEFQANLKDSLRRIDVCGPPNCCDTFKVPSVNFDRVCSLIDKECKALEEGIYYTGNKRNKIFYCVSPSFHEDFIKQQTSYYSDINSICKHRKDICPDLACCKHKSSKLDNASTLSKQEISKTVSKQINSSLIKLTSNETLTQEEKVDEFPKTKSVSFIPIVDLSLPPKQSSPVSEDTKPPFEELPFDPTTIDANQEIVIKNYLTTGEDFKPKNQDDTKAALKAVYTETSMAFIPLDSKKTTKECCIPKDKTIILKEKDSCCTKTINKQNCSTSNEFSSVGVDAKLSCCKSEIASTAKNNQNILSGSNTSKSLNDKCNKPCAADNKKAKPKTKHCEAATCEKLNTFPKPRKTCCSSKWCPINDPTASTCEFLLRVKQCCNTRNCQLAAKICDVYEPLVKHLDNEEPIEGEIQYHYLSTDAATEIVSESASEPDLKTEPERESIIISSDIISETFKKISSEEEISVSTTIYEPEEKQRVPTLALIPPTIDTEAFAPTGDTKRTSVVSWSMKSEDPRRSTASQEQVISRATAEADKFRQKPPNIRHVFNEVARKKIGDESKENVKQMEKSSEVMFKSELAAIQLSNHKHKQTCCAALLNKFKRKKKTEPEDSNIVWRSSKNQGKRKTKLGNTPVEEKKQQINTMLSKV